MQSGMPPLSWKQINFQRSVISKERISQSHGCHCYVISVIVGNVKRPIRNHSLGVFVGSVYYM